MSGEPSLAGAQPGRDRGVEGWGLPIATTHQEARQSLNKHSIVKVTVFPSEHFCIMGQGQALSRKNLIIRG